MKKVLLFYQKYCPFCVAAFKYLDELKEENPAYAGIEIETVDELKDKARADSYDYWYVPTLYVDGVKLHEGALTKPKLRDVLEKALEE